MTLLRGGARRVASGTLLLAAVLTACGSSSPPSNNPAPGGANYGYVVPQGASGPQPSPSANAIASSPAPTPVPATPAVPVTATPLTFALMPVGGVSGSVTVQPMGSSYSVTVEALGMAAGSSHAVHVHFGNCPSAGVHIVALAAITANSAGAGSSTTTVRSPYRGDGRFLIVYSGPTPGPLAACAQFSG